MNKLYIITRSLPTYDTWYIGVVAPTREDAIASFADWQHMGCPADLVAPTSKEATEWIPYEELKLDEVDAEKLYNDTFSVREVCPAESAWPIAYLECYSE